MRPNIICITPIKDIKGVAKILKKTGKLTLLEDPDENKLKKIIHKFDAIFTNPNKSKVYLSEKILKHAHNLKVICTASTGTNHIDKNYVKRRNIKVLSLTNERKLINKISSTAEHALGLTINSLRNINSASSAVLKGEWNFSKYIGRQFNTLTVGVIGLGRLGKKYSNYCNSLGSKVLYYDPFKKIKIHYLKKQTKLNSLLEKSDVISIHVHLTEKTKELINSRTLKKMKKNVLIINSSRGELVNEKDMINFLKQNKEAKYATDVIAYENKKLKNNKIIKFAKFKKNQVIITPHIGGMPIEARELAFNHAATLLNNFFKKYFEKKI